MCLPAAPRSSFGGAAEAGFGHRCILPLGYRKTKRIREQKGKLLLPSKAKQLPTKDSPLGVRLSEKNAKRGRKVGGKEHCPGEGLTAHRGARKGISDPVPSSVK